MTEFTNGIFKVIAQTSAGRALIYTCGHIIIAMSVVSVVTGASLFEAGIVAGINLVPLPAARIIPLVFISSQMT